MNSPGKKLFANNDLKLGEITFSPQKLNMRSFISDQEEFDRIAIT